MATRGDLYEAVTWLALESVFPGKEIKYEPKRQGHTCGQLCQYKKSCGKHKRDELQYTVPDFKLPEEELFFHVCHWSSKETSHAKYYRTMAELLEVKCFFPNFRCVSVVFESRKVDENHIESEGWYEEFLKAMDQLFDYTVYIPAEDCLEVEDYLNEPGGVKKCLSYIRKKGRLLRSATRNLNSVLKSSKVGYSGYSKMVSNEIFYCSQFDEQKNDLTQDDSELARNSMLQIILCALTLNINTREVLEVLSKSQRRVGSKEEIFMEVVGRLPVSNRGNEYQFMAKKKKSLRGISYVLNEEILWGIQASKDNPPLLTALEKTAELFSSSDQVQEAIASIKTLLAGNLNTNDISSWGRDQWIEHYLSVPKSNSYNIYGELLIEKIGIGTYPLVRLYNSTYSDDISRNTLRSIYSNKRPRKIQGYLHVIGNLSALPSQKNLTETLSGYLYRKCYRIIGSQSAINPLEEYVKFSLQSFNYINGFSLNGGGVGIKTLTSYLSNSQQIGNWNISMVIESKDEVIPLFISGMKGEADCGHKTREFTAHLRLARYTLSRGRIDVNRSLKRGVAILMGSYSERERRAFAYSNYIVCSLSSLKNMLISAEVISD